MVSALCCSGARDPPRRSPTGRGLLAMLLGAAPAGFHLVPSVAEPPGKGTPATHIPCKPAPWPYLAHLSSRMVARTASPSATPSTSSTSTAMDRLPWCSASARSKSPHTSARRQLKQHHPLA